MKTLKLNYILLFASIFLIASTVLNAQEVPEESGMESGETLQGEPAMEEVRERAEDAYQELEAEFIDDESDSTEVYDLMAEPETEVAEEDTTEIIEDPSYYEYGTEDEFTEEEDVYAESAVPQRHYHNQKLVNGTVADIVFSRIYRRADYAVMNPANIGIKSPKLWALTVPLPPNMGISLQNSAFTVGAYNSYFNDGRILTQEELDDFVGLFYEDGLNLKLNVSIPSLLAFKFPVGYGSAFINTGLVVEQDGTLPGELLSLPFKGVEFDDPIYTENMDMVVGAYLKTNIGYGTNIPIGGIGDLRVGASMNLYGGAFASANTENMTILSTPDSISLSGSAFTTMPDIENPDPAGILAFSPGFDIGAGFRMNLGQFFNAPDWLSNDLDIQLGLQDLNAKVQSGTMIKTYYAISGTVHDLETFNDENAVDSLLIQEETVVDSGYVDSYDIASRANIILTYQPMQFFVLQAGLTSFLTEGLGYDDAMHYNLNLYFFPVKWFSLNTGFQSTYNSDRILSAGFTIATGIYEFGLDSYFIGGTGENMKGIGLRMMSNWYF